MATKELTTPLRGRENDPGPYRNFPAIQIGKRLRDRPFGELIRIALAHEIERDPRERRRLEAKFEALLELLTPSRPRAEP